MMSSDHFQHHLHHDFHHAAAVLGHTAGRFDQTAAVVSPGASNFVGALESFTEVVGSAANLSTALTDQYQSLIEAHVASISPVGAHGGHG
jgi:hypothetical protein